MKKLRFVATLALLSAGFVVAQSMSSAPTQSPSNPPMSEQAPTGATSTTPAPVETPGATVPDNTTGQTPIPGDPSQTGAPPDTSSSDNTPTPPARGSTSTASPQSTPPDAPPSQVTPDSNTPNPH